MILHGLLDGRTLTSISRAIVLAAVLCAVMVVSCLGRLYWTGAQSRGRQASTEEMRGELAKVEEDIARAAARRKLASPSPEVAVSTFQSAAQKGAAEHGVVINEFTVTPDIQTFVSKYTNDTPPQGWRQVAIRMSFDGRVQGVMAALGTLARAETPFEIDQIDINRARIEPASGTTSVTAQVLLRVVLRT